MKLKVVRKRLRCPLALLMASFTMAMISLAHWLNDWNFADDIYIFIFLNVKFVFVSNVTEVCFHSRIVNYSALEEVMHDDVSKWKHFPRHWPFVRVIHRSPVNSPHKGQWHGALNFFHLALNKRLNKQSRRRWFETQSRSLWRHCNGLGGEHATGVYLNQWWLSSSTYVSPGLIELTHLA